MALNFNTSLIINTEASAGPSGESHTVREEGLGLSPREKTAGGKSWAGAKTPPKSAATALRRQIKSQLDFNAGSAPNVQVGSPSSFNVDLISDRLPFP